MNPKGSTMHDKLGRRDAFKKITAVSLAVVSPGLWLGCSKSTNCTDESGLSPDELKARNETAQYTEQTMDATKHCSLCALFVPPAQAGCGACKVLKGPINPNGYCKLFVAKAAP
jgi:High potential iron-sulfur protein